MKMLIRGLALLVFLSIYACEKWGVMDKADASSHAHENAFVALDR